MKVLVNKCPWTGKLFEDDALFAKHLKEIRAHQRHERDKARVAARFDEFVAPLYELGTTDEIAAWLTENYMKIAAHFGPKWSRKRRLPKPEDHVLIEIPPLRFEPQCSTTHSAPKGQRTTGWSKDSPHVPEAGWRGRIILYPKGKAYDHDWVDSDNLKKIGVNTGGGGGHSAKLSYELTLFTKDFPKLRLKAAANEVLRNHGRKGIDSNGKVLDEHLPFHG